MRKFICVLGIITGSIVWAADVQEIYVRAERTQVVETPRLGAKTLATAVRGTPLMVVSKRGTWYQVKTAAGIEGWVAQAFVTDQPITTASGLAAADSTDARSTRRRGSQAATMGVRGLTRGAGKLDAADADVKALQQVEENRVPAEELRKYEQDLRKD